MKAVKQTVCVDKKRNSAASATGRRRIPACFAACIASILDIPLDDIPNFCAASSDGDWWDEFLKWLKPRGLSAVMLLGRSGGKDVIFPGYYIASGRSIDRDRMHATIYDNGKLVHDPHPEGKGIKSVMDLVVIAPLNPAEFIKGGENF